jgi:hypothetical protein
VLRERPRHQLLSGVRCQRLGKLLVRDLCHLFLRAGRVAFLRARASARASARVRSHLPLRGAFRESLWKPLLAVLRDQLAQLRVFVGATVSGILRVSIRRGSRSLRERLQHRWATLRHVLRQLLVRHRRQVRISRIVIEHGLQDLLSDPAAGSALGHPIDRPLIGDALHEVDHLTVAPNLLHSRRGRVDRSLDQRRVDLCQRGDVLRRLDASHDGALTEPSLRGHVAIPPRLQHDAAKVLHGSRKTTTLAPILRRLVVLEHLPAGHLRRVTLQHLCFVQMLAATLADARPDQVHEDRAVLLDSRLRERRRFADFEQLVVHVRSSARAGLCHIGHATPPIERLFTRTSVAETRRLGEKRLREDQRRL